MCIIPSITGQVPDLLSLAENFDQALVIVLLSTISGAVTFGFRFFLRELKQTRADLEDLQARYEETRRSVLQTHNIYAESLYELPDSFPPQREGCPTVCPVRAQYPELAKITLDRINKRIKNTTED